MHPQRVGDMQQVAELHLVAGFHPLDRRPVETSLVGEGFLGEVLVQPSDAYAVADGFPGVEDPLRLIGWHALNRLRIMVASQQQICGILRS